MLVSVICTVLNERDSLESLLLSLIRQERKPDEIVIVDAGSNDGTIELLQRYAVVAKDHNIELRYAIKPGATRSEGRNAAVVMSRGEVIASIDGGCVADPRWLALLTRPFDDPNVYMVGGYYTPRCETWVQKTFARLFIKPAAELDPNTFLPSSRSVAFRREAWQKVGGYPDRLNEGEDTFFDLKMREKVGGIVIVPEALVEWEPPKTLSALIRQHFRYARGDGQGCIHGTKYLRAWARVLLLIGGMTTITINPLVGVCLLGSVLAYYCVRHRTLSWAVLGVLVALDVANSLGFLLGSMHQQRLKSV